MSFAIGPHDTRTLSGLIIGLVVLGVVLLVANVPSSPLRSAQLGLFVIFVLPLIISLLAYIRFAEPVVWWEVALLAVWGVLSIIVTAFIGFLATMGTPGGYPGAVTEIVRHIAMFLAATLGLGVTYGIAGKFRQEHPRRTVVSAVRAFAVLFILFNVAAVAV